MKTRLLNFRFKAWHFMLLLVMLFVVTTITAKVQLKSDNSIELELCITEVKDQTFEENILSGVNFVLFYSDGEKSSDQMEYNLGRLAEDKCNEASFYKLNADMNTDLGDKYKLSGTPTILIFKDGVEMKRVMGVVPISNLRMIYNRISEQD